MLAEPGLLTAGQDLSAPGAAPRGSRSRLGAPEESGDDVPAQSADQPFPRSIRRTHVAFVAAQARPHGLTSCGAGLQAHGQAHGLGEHGAGDHGQAGRLCAARLAAVAAGSVPGVDVGEQHVVVQSDVAEAVAVAARDSCDEAMHAQTA